jgi:proton-dependent oligopeptide transporter, POT family
VDVTIFEFEKQEYVPRVRGGSEVHMSSDEKVVSRTPWEAVKEAFREMGETFVAFAKAPRALWGVNISYVFEGFIYFGMLGYMAMFFNKYVGLGDEPAGVMVGVLTWGITFSMFIFGSLGDKYGFRKAMIWALILMFIGRVIMSGGTAMGLEAGGLWSPIHWVSLFGIFFIVLGYGMYQPAAYAAVRQVTTKKTAAMGYAMLYALMNLGGWLPSFFSPVRKAIGISGSYWVFTSFTLVGLALLVLILTRKVAQRAIDEARTVREKEDVEPDESAGKKEEVEQSPLGKWFFVSLVLGLLFGVLLIMTLSAAEETVNAVWTRIGGFVGSWRTGIATTGTSIFLIATFVVFLKKRPDHPFRNARFTFFIFALIPVQTLFAHNWLTLPMYVERAFRGTAIGDNFEFAVNLNPLLIFILVPVVTALTQKKKVYTMMIAGTFVMAAPTFFLAFGASVWTLFAYLLIMTIGEAMWQPRFLQYAAEIAPEGKTAMYMGVAQFPWFLTKVVTSFYSGWFLSRYCPDPTTDGEMNTETMWLIYALIAISSTAMLVLARGWMKRGDKNL